MPDIHQEGIVLFEANGKRFAGGFELNIHDINYTVASGRGIEVQKQNRNYVESNRINNNLHITSRHGNQAIIHFSVEWLIGEIQQYRISAAPSSDKSGR